jgi:hypothetical protein
MTVETPGGPTFYLTELQINGIDAQETNLDAVPDPITGCGGQVFDVQIFNPLTDLPYECIDLELFGDVTVLEEATPGIIDCDLSTLSFEVSPVDDEDRDYKIEFVNAPSAISYITLVSRES